MKFPLAITIFIALCFQSTTKPFGSTTQEENKVVVLELFTSEGCSSCPPADRLLSEYSKDDDAIIALSFHVHYWDRLGWSDPYSSQKYSDRQRMYAQKLNIRKVFTPHMIANGLHSFVGSDKDEAEKAIKSAKADPMLVNIKISELVVDGNYCQFNYRLSESSKKTTVNFALTEDGLSQKVLKGENKNKLLMHDNVVRTFKSQESPSKSGEMSLRLPDDGNVENMNVVVYIQQNDDLEIIGAASKRVK